MASEAGLPLSFLNKPLAADASPSLEMTNFIPSKARKSPDSNVPL